jgi:hypothetical protein
VRSEQFGSSNGRFPSLASLDREFVRHEDDYARPEDEYAPEADEYAPDEYVPSELEPEQRWLPRLWILLLMAVAGVVLAFIWHNIKPNISFANLSAQTTTAAAPATAQDVEALKKTITELRDTQQQLVTKIAALEAAQQHMQQELSPHSTLRWYSDSNILMYRTATAHAPKPPSSTKPKPTPHSVPHPQDANATQPNGAPLSLDSGRP